MKTLASTPFPFYLKLLCINIAQHLARATVCGTDLTVHPFQSANSHTATYEKSPETIPFTCSLIECRDK